MAVNIEPLVINFLMEGKTQSEISKLLKEQKIEPNSLSTIEQCVRILKAKNKAKTLIHLGALLTRRYDPNSSNKGEINNLTVDQTGNI